MTVVAAASCTGGCFIAQVTSHSGDDVDADLLLVERRLLASAGGGGAGDEVRELPGLRTASTILPVVQRLPPR